jgi:hypothetical protein
LRGVGHLFFLAIQNAGFKNKKLRWNRLWRAAARSGVAGYMRRKKKIEGDAGTRLPRPVGGPYTGLHARPEARVWGGSQLAEDHHTVSYLQRMPMWQLVTLSRSYSLPHS